jgi:hypothetical protein
MAAMPSLSVAREGKTVGVGTDQAELPCRARRDNQGTVLALHQTKETDQAEQNATDHE